MKVDNNNIRLRLLCNNLVSSMEGRINVVSTGKDPTNQVHEAHPFSLHRYVQKALSWGFRIISRPYYLQLRIALHFGNKIVRRVPNMVATGKGIHASRAEKFVMLFVKPFAVSGVFTISQN